jgi:thioredoxin reductase
MDASRRDFLKATGAALTTSIFTGNVRGANDRIRVAFIGMGRMGTESMENALQLSNVEVPVVCDEPSSPQRFAGIVAVRQARSGAPRGPFCGMGVCFDCLVTVDGRPSQRACLTKAQAGMDVRSAPVATPRQPEPAAPAEEIACDVLVVGAGPAGLSAARALALAGADVIVADERLHPGGQYFKPLAPSHQADPSTLDRQFRDGAILRQSALLAGVRILSEATVWAAFSPHEVAAIVAGRSILFRPKRLVLATGAYEQSLPVPGWTLPGVLTVGGLQTLARSYRVAPGQRIVVAGNGPLCLQTAAELREGGTFLRHLERRFKHGGKWYTAKILPARLEDTDGQWREYYPSPQEELVEEALKKIACDQLTWIFHKKAQTSWKSLIEWKV